MDGNKRIYSRALPHLGQNFASSLRTCPHFGHTLVMGLFGGVICCGLSLTIRYRSSPSKLRKNTIIAQSAPFIPRDSASLYTNTRIKRPTTNQRSGMRNKTEKNKYSILPNGLFCVGLNIIFAEINYFNNLYIDNIVWVWG